MAIIPGIAGDQPYVAKAVEEWGAGLALPADADAGATGAADVIAAMLA
jgi:UDP:flavonoid glycosyltransferase YjiC (YdhE family)